MPFPGTTASLIGIPRKHAVKNSPAYKHFNQQKTPGQSKHFFWHLERGTSKSVFVECLFLQYLLQKIIDVSFNRNILNNQ